VHTDRAIARRILGGDEAAFRELFDNYFPRIYRFALARLDGNRSEARELAQVTFCRAFERLDSYRGEASLFAWFCQICRNAIIDSARSRQRFAAHTPLQENDAGMQDLLEALSAPEDQQPEHFVWRADMMRLIQAALDHLPARYGDILEWKYLDGLSVEDIASRLAISPKAAESALTRARHAFRESIVTINGSLDFGYG
jgi:RNA polymerase sigma-70 factor, ECF subfamily